jgi:hypothetical protein
VVDGHGLRLDGTIQDPTSGELVWFDVSVVHTTCKTHLKDEVKLTLERRVAGEEGAGWKSAALMEAHQGKLNRYALLAAMVERQVLAGRRTAPLILPAVVTTHGEFCPGTVQLQEWLVERYRARLRLEGDRDDGEEEDDLITAFRCELRAALLVAVAKGTAKMLAVAGRPFRKGGAQRSGAWPGARAPAASAAGHGADDSAVSDSGDNDSGSDDVSESDSDNDNATDSGSTDSDSSTTPARGGSKTRGGSSRGAAQPRPGTRHSARLAQRGSSQPESTRDSAPDSSSSSSSTSSSSCSSSSSSSLSSSSVCNSNSSGEEARHLVAGGLQDQPFPFVDSL